MTERQWRVLRALGVANLVDNYDGALLGLALPQIQASLAVGDDAVGQMIAIVRLGVIPAIVLTVLADRIGRRGLLLTTIVAFTGLTFLTALVGDANQFMTVQFLARIFVAAENILAIVVIAEEFDARNRGWGIGILGAMGALGYALASITFSLVNLLPFGWRALYALGVLPLLLVVWMRRSLHETQRFEAERARHDGGGLAAVLQPLRNLARMYPGRMLALCAALFPYAFVAETAMLFHSKFLQDAHGYTPGNVATMHLTVGIFALLGNVVAGTLGDRFGRKRVLVTALVAFGVAVWGFYSLSGWIVPLMWGLMAMCITMSLVLFGALGSELFPTSYRSTASGVRAAVATLGASGGLWMEGVLFGHFGSHATAITAMLILLPIAPLVVAFALPETANRELEEVSPERD